MKTYIVSFVVFGILLSGSAPAATNESHLMDTKALGSGGGQGLMPGGDVTNGAGYTSLDTSGVGGGSANYQPISAKPTTGDTANTTSDAAKTDETKTAATEDKRSEDEKKKEKECSAAKAQAERSGTQASEANAAKKCEAADYTKTATQLAETPTGNAVAMGADARDQSAYNPPQNLKINGQEISWAKYESFRQIGQSKGFSDQAIQGIAGRLQVESANKAFAVNGTGATVAGDRDKRTGAYTSFGIEQWHNERADALVGYINDNRASRAEANSTSFNQASISGKSGQGLKFSTYDQYNYVFDEGKQNPGVITGGTRTYDQLKNSTSALDAAHIWTAKVERPAAQSGQAFGLAGGNETAKYAQGFAQAGDNNYVADTSAWGSRKTTTYTGLDSSYVANTVGRGGVTTGNNGLGNNVQQVVGGLFGGNGSNPISQILGNVTGGNNAMGNIINSVMNGGQVNTGDIASVVAQLAVQKLFGSGSSGSSSGGSSGGGSSGGSVRTNSTERASSYDALRALADKCGGDLPNSADAVMLMVKTCQG